MHPFLDILEQVPNESITCLQTCSKCNRPSPIIEVAPNVFSGHVYVDGTHIELEDRHVRVAKGDWIGIHHLGLIRTHIHVCRLTRRSGVKPPDK